MVNISQQIKCDCLIVGCGAAGLRAAIECLENGLIPLLVAKRPIGQSNTIMAEGGVNAAIGQRDPSDNWKVHYDDTMKAGRFINCRMMVETLCKEAPNRMYDLLAYGAGFEKDEKGMIVQAGRMGGQTKDRVIAVGDFTGFVIQRALLSRALRLGLKVLDEMICLKVILTDDGEAAGVFVFDLRNSRFIMISSPNIILACGGAGRLFSRSTNGAGTTGEGYVLGLEAGIELRDMEMIQFHPTTLCSPRSAQGIDITEAARMRGGRLYNARGERFMEHYDPERLELACRDAIALAIAQEVKQGRGSRNGGVFLDLTHIDTKVLLKTLPNTVETARTFQCVDVTKRPIEVAPAAHYFMGGLVPSNMETMETIPGLFICGEIAWGPHGANRLGGNSLTDTQVFGARAGKAAALRSRRTKGKKIYVGESRIAEELRSIGIIMEIQSNHTRTPIHYIRNELEKTMYEHVGVIRDRSTLEDALVKIELLEEEFRRCRKTIDNYYSFSEIFECSKMLILSRLIVQSALFRKESRGAHFRSDFPKESTELFNTSIFPKMPYQIQKVDVI
jgi:succinate dehydrogenase/fumarate reductase flavoprotein subunit